MVVSMAAATTSLMPRPPNNNYRNKGIIKHNVTVRQNAEASDNDNDKNLPQICLGQKSKTFTAATQATRHHLNLYDQQLKSDLSSLEQHATQAPPFYKGHISAPPQQHHQRSLVHHPTLNPPLAPSAMQTQLMQQQQQHAQQQQLQQQHRPTSSGTLSPVKPLGPVAPPGGSSSSTSGVGAPTNPAKRVTEYKIIAKIGSGTFSEVYKCRRITDDIMWACKVLKKKYADENHVNKLREVQALRRLNPHPNILKLEELIFDPQNGRLILICELMDMNLYEFIKSCNKQRLSEVKVGEIMYQIVKAVQHMHSSGIFHRDIKPENILVKTASPYEKLEVKLADFGSCKGIFSRHPYTEYISTRWYRAPECLLTDGYYSYPMDVWSIGCVFFETTTFRPLFPGSNELDQINKIHELLGTPSAELLYKFKKSRALSFEFPKYEAVDLTKSFANDFSTVGLDLLRKFLTYDPDARISTKEALQHPFLSENAAADRTSGEKQEKPKVIITQNKSMGQTDGKIALLNGSGSKGTSGEASQQIGNTGGQGVKAMRFPQQNQAAPNDLHPVEQAKPSDVEEAKDLPMKDKEAKPQIKVFINKSVVQSDSPASRTSPGNNQTSGVASVVINKKATQGKSLAAVAELAGAGSDAAPSPVKVQPAKRSVLDLVDPNDGGNSSPHHASPTNTNGAAAAAGQRYQLPQESYEEAKALILQNLHQRQPKRHNSLIWKKFYNTDDSSAAVVASSSLSPQPPAKHQPGHAAKRTVGHGSEMAPVTLTISESNLTTGPVAGGGSVSSMALFKELFSTEIGKPGATTGRRSKELVLDVYKKPLGKYANASDRQSLPKIQENLNWLTTSSTTSNAGTSHHISGAGSPTRHHFVIGGEAVGASHHVHQASSPAVASISPQFGASGRPTKVHIPTVGEKAEKSNVK